jgi:MFS superfamily sulfate permease-like transporter
VLGLLWGIGVAIALSLLNFIRRAWYPHDAVLGRVDQLKGYHDTQRYPDARRVPGLVLYRFDAPLFFANADLFHAHVIRLADGAERIVVAAEPITDIDATAGEMLGTLIDELRGRGVELAFAELKDPMHDLLRRYGIEPQVYPTLGVAVAAYVRERGVDWHDWEDGGEGNRTPTSAVQRPRAPVITTPPKDDSA